MPQIIVSTCGTSVLTNGSDNQLRSAVNRHSNLTSPSEIAEPETLKTLEAHIAQRRSELLAADAKRAAALSAEINGIQHLYPRGLNSQDEYYLIRSDTWLGQVSAEMLAEWLRNSGLKPQIVEIKDLRTDDVETFHAGLSDLVTWCHETLPGYRDSQYKIIFNLTGGFKSVQGFMQTLSHFYADEAVYVFESGKELLRLPRLPVHLDPEGVVRDNLTTFRRLDKRLKVNEADLVNIPETFLLRVRGITEPGISAWGEVIYRQSRDQIYSERLWESPSSRIVYGPKFADSLANLNHSQMKQINERIDDLAACLELGQCPQRLNLHAIRANPKPPSTHEIYAWSDGSAERIFCHYQDSGSVLVLDNLGGHL